jgi:hypothetical protein
MTAPQEEMVPLYVATQHLRLADFAGRVLLAVNLLLAIYFCYTALLEIPDYRNILVGGMNAQLPEVTQLLFRIPATSLCGSAAGLAAALIVLEVVARSRKTRIICNAIALFLLATAILFVDAAMRLPWHSVMYRVQKS